LVCGDFNMIYQVEYKSKGRLNRRLMGQFRQFLNDAAILEIHLHERLSTWSKEREHPTLERIDRAFISVDWEALYPSHDL
jgi:hypothetical protein